MNTLLHLGDIALQYYLGRKTGLAGIAGIFITIVIVVAWDYISPIFQVTGITAFLESMGLITPGDAALSGFKILFAIIAVYLLLILVTIPAIVLFAILHRFVSSKLGTYGMIVVLGIILSPFLIIYSILKLFIRRPRNLNTQHLNIQVNPKSIVDELLTYKINNDDINALYSEVAKEYLNRLPTLNDRLFLIGITDADEMYALLPRPFGVPIYGDIHNKLFCKPMNIRKYNSQKDRIPSYYESPENFFAEIVTDPKISDIDIEKYDSYRFEHFIEANNMPDLLNAFSIYMESDQYKSYVSIIQTHFFTSMDEIKHRLENSLDKEHITTLKQELNYYKRITNQNIVRSVWEGKD